MRSASVLLLLCVGCAPEVPEPEVRQTITSGVGEVLHPSQVYVRFLAPEAQLVVFDKLEGVELARGPVTAGARFPLSLGGRPCELESRGTEVETDVIRTERPRDSTTRLAMPTRERQATVAKVTLRCADGPVPGVVAPPSVRGFSVVTWLPLALVAGVLGALLYRRGDAMELAGLAALFVAAVACFVVGWKVLDGALWLTVPLLAVVVGACGATATLLWASDSKLRVRGWAVGVVVSAFVGPTVIAAMFPLWAAGAALAAIGVSAVCVVIALVVAVA